VRVEPRHPWPWLLGVAHHIFRHRSGGALFWISPTIAFNIIVRRGLDRTHVLLPSPPHPLSSRPLSSHHPWSLMTWQVGLGLDYDIFFMESVLEHYDRGVGAREAVAQALQHTGNVIAIAGVIMLIAFAAMLFSKTPVLSQITFMLSVGVVCACFVSTKVLVPAVMAAIPDRANFWPRKPRTDVRAFSVCSTPPLERSLPQSVAAIQDDAAEGPLIDAPAAHHVSQ
jgi:hypothetical protein